MLQLPVIVFVALVVLFLWSAIRVLNEYERGVIFRLGRVIKAKGPGLIILIPIVDKMVKVSLRLVVSDVDPQDVITRDNVSVKVNAVIYFRVIEPTKAVLQVEDYRYAMSQLAQTTLRSVCGQAELDELLSAREKNQQPAAGDLGHAHRSLGNQSRHGGTQTHRSAPGNAARHG